MTKRGTNDIKEYETLRLIKEEDLNRHGTLFAARAAGWFVEAAFAAAACEYGTTAGIVCRNLHDMSFSVRCKKEVWRLLRVGWRMREKRV